MCESSLYNQYEERIREIVLKCISQYGKCKLYNDSDNRDSQYHRWVVQIEKEKVYREFIADWFSMDTEKLPNIDDGDYKFWGGKFLFLFHENIKKTNCYMAEFIALLHRFIVNERGENRLSLHLLSHLEFKTLFLDLIEDIVDEFNNSQDHYTEEGEAQKNFPKDWDLSVSNSFSSYMKCILPNIVVTDHYSQSCNILVPKTLRIDIDSITKYSGYIHSSGISVYARRARKALNPMEIKENFDCCLRAINAWKPRTIRMIPYSEFIFSDMRYYWSDIENLRINLDKMYVGKMVLANLIKYLEEELNIENNRVVSVVRKDDESEIKGDFDERMSFWFVKDCPVKWSARREIDILEEDVYIFLYLQLLYHVDPSLAFDEDKIPWYAPVTIPQKLSRAICNVAELLYYSAPLHDGMDGKRVKIFDPFCGTGAILRDAIYIFGEDNDFIGNDKMGCSSIIYKHTDEFLKSLTSNLDFLHEFQNIKNSVCSDDYKILSFNDGDVVKEFIDCLCKKFIDAFRGVGIKECQKAKEDNVNFFSKILNDINSVESGDSLTDNAKFLIFYIFWITVNEIASFKYVTSKGAEEEIFTKAMKDVLERYDKKLRKYRSEFKDIKKGIGKYSSLSYKLPVFSKQIEMKGSDFVDGSAEWGEYDIVITDPPYGFNDAISTDRNYSDFFSSVIGKMVSRLSSPGVLMLCIPSNAKNGRQIYRFQTRNFLIKKVIQAANLHGKRVVNPVRLSSTAEFLAKPPFYWRSRRGVNRDVLAFLLMDKSIQT